MILETNMSNKNKKYSRNKTQDIYPTAVSIATRLLIRQSDKYLVLPGPAIYPANDLNGLSRYLRALSGACGYRLRLCLCGGTTSTHKDTTAAGQLTTSTLASREVQIASRTVSYLPAAASNLLPNILDPE